MIQAAVVAATVKPVAAVWTPPFRAAPAAVVGDIKGLLAHPVGGRRLAAQAPGFALCAESLDAESVGDRLFVGAMAAHWSPRLMNRVALAAHSNNEAFVADVVRGVVRSYDQAVPEFVGSLEEGRTAVFQALARGQIDADQADQAIDEMSAAQKIGPAARAAFRGAKMELASYRLANGLADVFKTDDAVVEVDRRAAAQRRLDDSLGVPAFGLRSREKWAASGVLRIMRALHKAQGDERMRLADALARAAQDSPFPGAQKLVLEGFMAEVERDTLPGGRIDERSAPLVLAVSAIAARLRDSTARADARVWVSRQLLRMSAPSQLMRWGPLSFGSRRSGDGE